MSNQSEADTSSLPVCVTSCKVGNVKTIIDLVLKRKDVNELNEADNICFIGCTFVGRIRFPSCADSLKFKNCNFNQATFMGIGRWTTHVWFDGNGKRLDLSAFDFGNVEEINIKKAKRIQLPKACKGNTIYIERCGIKNLCFLEGTSFATAYVRRCHKLNGVIPDSV